MKLQIKVSEWFHRPNFQTEKPESCLYDPSNGKKCCLGFYLNACGVPLEVMKFISTPILARDIIPEQAKWLITDISSNNSEEANRLMVANDGGIRRITNREVIRTIFADHGVEVEFDDEVVDEKPVEVEEPELVMAT